MEKGRVRSEKQLSGRRLRCGKRRSQGSKPQGQGALEDLTCLQSRPALALFPFSLFPPYLKCRMIKIRIRRVAAVAAF